MNPFENRPERTIGNIDAVDIAKVVNRDSLLRQSEINHASTIIDLRNAERTTRKAMACLTDEVRIGIIGIVADYGLTGLEAGSKLRNLFLDLTGGYSTISGIVGFHVTNNQTLINSLKGLKGFLLHDCALMVGKDNANTLMILIKEADKIEKIALA